MVAGPAAKAGAEKPEQKGKPRKKVSFAVKRKEEKEKRMIERRIKMLDEETAKELEKGLEDEDYRIEKILKHSDDMDGVRQYKVRYVGYGPSADLWYDEADLRETAPGMVDAHEESLKERPGSSREGGKPKGGKKSRGKNGTPKRRSSVGSGRV